MTLAESLLPPDAEQAGTFTLGTTIASTEINTLWRILSLAARFANFGENRGGESLVVSTGEPLRPAIQQGAPRMLALPE